MLIVDAHQDIAWSGLTFARDLTLGAHQTRHLERGRMMEEGFEEALLGWPDYQRGSVTLIFATLFATPLRWRSYAWDTICYTEPIQAKNLYRAQLEFYWRLVEDHPDQFRLILRRHDLDEHLSDWAKLPEFSQDGETLLHSNPVGLTILMEGAEAVQDPGELEQWWQDGVRIIGPAWANTPYSGGTDEPGPLTKAGFFLLERMGELGFGLDISHMDEKAALQACDIFPGQILASHSNALALLPGVSTNRHLSDKVIRGILQRDGVIGIVGYNKFLKSGWERGDPRSEVTIDRLADHIDYICQIAGDPFHVGIGTDFDGGFGLQSVPIGIDTITDIKKIEPLLRERGYSEEDCAAIMGGNWLNVARAILPEN